MYRGPDAVYKFIERMLEEEKWCQETLKKHFNNHIVMTEEDEENFNQTDSCHICGINQSYITDKYRGSAHQKCNINYKLTEKTQVIFHNLRGHDSLNKESSFKTFNDKS